MKLKSYFANTVEAAMALARQEMGEDALLMHSRPATPETKYLGAYEVVFASGSVDDAAPATPSVPMDRLTRDVAELKRDLSRMAMMLSTAQPLAAELDQKTGGAAQLIAAGLDPDLAARCADGSAIESLFTCDSSLGRPGCDRRVVALVGPPGAGKTTTLVKLAARYGLVTRRPARILTADVHRIAAVEQLRTLAGILGIGLDIAEAPGALAQSLEEHKGKDLILIDTPGFAPAQMDDAAQLAGFLAGHPEIDTHLVLPACMSAASLSRAAGRFLLFSPSKLLFTHIDEAASYGSIVNEAVRARLPISFVAAGQSIPEDLEPATCESIAALVAANIPEHRAGAAA